VTICYYTVHKGLYIIPCVIVSGETEKAINIRQNAIEIGIEDEALCRWLPKSKTSFLVLESISYVPIIKETEFEKYNMSVEGQFGHVEVQDWLFGKVTAEVDKCVIIKYLDFKRVFGVKIDETGYNNGSKRTYKSRPETSGYVYFPEGLTEDEYKSIYRRLSLIYHPDVGIKDDNYFKAVDTEYKKLIARFQ